MMAGRPLFLDDNKHLLDLPMSNKEKIQLIPLTEEHKELFYQWTLQSDATLFLFGPGTGEEMTDRAGLFEDYQDHYFSDDLPELGRCYGIKVQDRLIGQVNYNEIENEGTELDIWIASKEDWGKGYGSKALQMLVKLLHEERGLTHFLIVPVSANTRAIQAYQKAGFQILETYFEKGVEWVKMQLIIQK